MPKFYGSVNGATKEVKKLYGGVKEPIYEYTVNSIANNSSLNMPSFNSKWYSVYGPMRVQPTSLSAQTAGGTTSVILSFDDGVSKFLFSYNGAYTNQGAAWGFAQAPADGTVASAGHLVGYNEVAKKIVKLYGSVNGSAKLVYED